MFEFSMHFIKLTINLISQNFYLVYLLLFSLYNEAFNFIYAIFQWVELIRKFTKVLFNLAGNAICFSFHYFLNTFL